MKTNQKQWAPGSEVEVVARRLRLRSLRPSDIPPGSEPAWYGDRKQRTHIWSPNLPIADYLRGLAGAADNKNYFALLSILKDSQTPIGLAKGQLDRSEGQRVFVLTTLIGDPKHTALMLGYETTSAALWFANTQLSISEISTRIYDENQSTIKMMEQFKYRLHSTTKEQGPGGERVVRDYRKTSEQWMAEYAERFADWPVQVPAD